MRNTTCHHEWLFYFFGLDHHRDKGILRWVDDCAGVDEDQICFIDAINNVVPILRQLAYHELAVRDIVGTSKGLDVYVMSSRSFFDDWLFDNLFILLGSNFDVFVLFLLLYSFFLPGQSLRFISKIKQVSSYVLEVVNF